MHRIAYRFPILLSSTFVVVALASGCSRSEKTTPVAESKTEHPVQQVNQAVTVTGCLRGGDAAETFVLTTSGTTDGTGPATYQLAGASGVTLRDHIGHRVEVNGIVRTQQQTETRAAGPAANSESATGTSGTPRVETRTEVDIKHLDVSNVKAVADTCDQ